MSGISKMAEDVCCLYPFLNNNKVESIHGQSTFVGDYETPVQSKNEGSYFRRKTLIQASNWLTTVMPIDPGTTLSPED